MEIPNNKKYDHQPKYDEPEVKKEKPKVKKEKPKVSTKKFSDGVQKIGNIKFEN